MRTIEGDPIDSLLGSALDYAGLFPPAQLDMASAVAGYGRAVHSGRWLLGSFVVPLVRAAELEEAAADLVPSTMRLLPLSVVLPAIPEETVPGEAVAELERWRERWRGRLEVSSLEIPPLEPARVAEVVEALPDDVEAFFEVPLGVDTEDEERMQELLQAIAVAGASAKVRTGGLEAKAFPDVIALSSFLAACHHRALPFKATAGLHHALRGSYEIVEHGSRVWMHGFVNLVVGAALLMSGKVTDRELVEVLSESQASAFEVERSSVRWRDREVVIAELARNRRGFFQSFGSCSFTEPLEELQDAAWIPRRRRAAV